MQFLNPYICYCCVSVYIGSGGTVGSDDFLVVVFVLYLVMVLVVVTSDRPSNLLPGVRREEGTPCNARLA